MVLDAGQLKEFDTPANLLRQSGSIFASMVDDTGAESAKHLREVRSVPVFMSNSIIVILSSTLAWY